MPQKPEILNSEFIKSAVNPSDYPVADRPEIAMVGRSNAGKSSLLNNLLGRELARISQSPGKTKLLNFFNCGKYYRLVDLPGYGYSKSTQKEMEAWKIMIEAYLRQRENLKGVILVMDIRRDWGIEEEHLITWLSSQKIPVLVALTKIDKLNSTELNKCTQGLKKQIQLQSFGCSNLDKKGIVELENFIFNNWVKV